MRALILGLAVVAACTTPARTERGVDASIEVDAGGVDASIEADGGGVDAGADGGSSVRADAGSCPVACSECTDGICRMNGCPDAGCSCPAGMPCSVYNMSSAGVNCSQATDCSVDCAGPGACFSGVTCGTGACRIVCGGIPSCVGPIDCTRARTCDIACTQDACRGPIACGGLSCKIACSDMVNGCLGVDPIVCDAGSCEIDCSQGCYGRPLIQCGAGHCKIDYYSCTNMCPVTDCSKSCGCQITNHGPKPTIPSCPPFCDGGCDSADASTCSRCR